MGNQLHFGKKAHIAVRADSGLVHTVTTTAANESEVEHPFRVIKRQFGLAKVRFRGLAKNTAHVVTQFALLNPWMAPKKLMAMAGVVRPQAGGG